MRSPGTEVCLHHLVEAAASFAPHSAIVCRGTSVSYEELIGRANRLARELQAMGVGEGEFVALYLPRSADTIVAQLAVLKAGAAYLPLDRTHPLERKRFILADARPAAVITSTALAAELGTSDRFLLLDGARVAAPDTDEVWAGRPDAAAYVTYTSGSTGQPKGALNSHRGAVNYIRHMISARGLRPGERVLQFTSFSFDGSVRDTLGTLAFGGTIVLLDDESARQPSALLATLRQERASLILSIVPTMLRRLVQAALEQGGRVETLRLAMVAGERLLWTDVEAARRAFGANLEVVNQYGATECSMVASDYVVPAVRPEQPSLPVGKPIANDRIYILNRDRIPVASGEEGEIYIGGAGVGLGYLNRPELTAERFLPDPFASAPDARMYATGDRGRHLPDGTIEYMGRADQQVKIQGHRVELGEIEAVLLRHPAVRQAAVVWRMELLAAYVALRDDTRVGELRAFVATEVPFHMVPSSIVVMDELPLTSTGKIDRTSLPRPAAPPAGGAPLPPRSVTEARLVALWESVLGVDGIGISDTFFALGGDSVQAMELFAGVEREFGRALPISVLYEGSTVEAFARALDEASGLLHPGIIPLQPRGTLAPLFVVPAYLYLRELASCFAPVRPVYGLRAGAPFTRPIEEEARLLYEVLIAFHSSGPYLLVGHSAGGYLALEIARLLLQHGKRVDFLGLLDTLPPGPRRQATLRERVHLHLENLSARNPRGILEHVAGSAKRLALRGVRRLPGGLTLMRALAKRSAEPWVERLVVHRYAAERFSGDVTLFAAATRPWYVRWDPMDRWDRTLAGKVRLVPVPGSHLSVVKQPQVASLAREIEALLPRQGAAVIG